MDPMGFPEEKLKPLTFDPILPKSGGQTKVRDFQQPLRRATLVFFFENCYPPSVRSSCLFGELRFSNVFSFRRNTIEDVQERIQVLVSIGKSSLKKRSSSCYKTSMMT